MSIEDFNVTHSITKMIDEPTTLDEMDIFTFPSYYEALKAETTEEEVTAGLESICPAS